MPRVYYVFDQELFLHRPHEMNVGPPPSFEAEIASRFRADQIFQRLLEQWKRWLKVDAIG